MLCRISFWEIFTARDGDIYKLSWDQPSTATISQSCELQFPAFWTLMSILLVFFNLSVHCNTIFQFHRQRKFVLTWPGMSVLFGFYCISADSSNILSLIAPFPSSVLCKVPKTREAQFTQYVPSLLPQKSSLPPIFPRNTHRAVACWGYGDKWIGMTGNRTLCGIQGVKL